jgi:intracellular sulfur oxidation DsrE/DsrF family protein
MFAATKLAEGTVLDAIQNTLDAYASTGVAASTVATAAVLYHEASIGMAFDDAAWLDLFIPAFAQAPSMMKADIEAYKSAKGNPLRQPRTPNGASVEGLVAKGTRFYVCNNATKGFAGMIAGVVKSTPPEVYGRLVKGLLPGATLVPAGVWAVHALQERRFTYLQTTL